MTMNETLNKALEAIDSFELAEAIRLVRQFMSDNPYLRYGDQLDGIEEDYHRMLDYMRNGFADSQRENIYKRLLLRMERFVQNLDVVYKRQKSVFYIEAFKRVTGYNFGHDQVKEKLESFTSDVAMLSLEPDDVRQQRSGELYSNYQNYRNALFCYLATDLQWTDDDAAFYERLLLSPTIDSTDARLIVSAIMLSAMNNYDFLKFSVLLHVYQQSVDVHVKQRALVGWLFVMERFRNNRGEQSKLIRGACDDPQTVTDIIDTQKQVILCMNADRDHDRIHNEIFPSLMKNSNLNITRQGVITEKEDDAMEDIFDPEAADRRMEEMEASINQMINMQKSGADVYFGGFSHMKRYPFFYILCNWFVPFYVEHPELVNVIKKISNSRLMTNLMNSSPFCDSDKYSFTLTMYTVVDRLPKQMLSLLDSTDALGPTIPEEEQQKPAYIRRMYLQDLYRFFRLYPHLGDIVSPFSDKRFVFTAAPVFTGTPLDRHYAELCMFFRKQKNEEAFGQLIHQYDDDNDVNCQLLQGIYHLECGHSSLALEPLHRLLELEPMHERGLFLLARASFMEMQYEEAVEYYERLYKMKPQNKAYVLNYCLALCKNDNYEEASGLLFKLDYENPDQPDVQRMLAWVQMGLHRLDQAEKIYEKLLSSKRIIPSDYLNAGYCYWFKGDIQKAIECLKQYVKSGKVCLNEDLMNDGDMFERHNISLVDLKLMKDMVEN